MRLLHFFRLFLSAFLLLIVFCADAQTAFKTKFTKGNVYVGIEVGSKGVKMSVVEISKTAQTTGNFNILKDSTFNTDFISFTQATFDATLASLTSFYNLASSEYKIPVRRIFTVISSGVKMQAEKENKAEWIANLITAFQKNINDPGRKVDVIDVMTESKLSHLGIIPNARRYNSFLIDIGSGNTKGGYFPFGNTNEFKMFQVNWGTKSTTNATDKTLGDDVSLANFKRQLSRVLEGAENNDIIYAVNVSGAYALSDNIVCSGGIAWSVATLIYPELVSNSVVPVTYEEVAKFHEQLYSNYKSLSPEELVKRIKDPEVDKEAVLKEIKRVHGVFDQKSLIAGTGLLLKIMRQFKSIYETKQFFMVKTGQVGWISAYVDEAVE
ncbi:hypothetical protein PDL71_10120 [Lacibacter sp. MH-610]|uniref:hypothetical protein n=1 Tax=Lacibacter sp. MH-610 TaxID=3020883 RepID=UPI003891A6C6